MSTTSRLPFVPAAWGDKRSPCPALNALANHGYLPHDGKNIGFWQLMQAVRSVYNLSFPLAALLAIVGIFLCGHALRLDLDKLALHNRIEHDASLVHGDALPGHVEAPIPVDPELLDAFLSHANEKQGLSLDSFAQLRVDREARLTSPLDHLHSEIGTGEAALCWLLLKKENGQVPLSMLEQWYGEERIPDGWVPPTEGVGLFGARQTATKVANKMEEIRRR
ncbi:Chloroperoxidase [Boletus coccyginus]|nr:Chloroperoxidase [Boletus coccyginus]